LRHWSWRQLIPRFCALIAGGLVGTALFWPPSLHEVYTPGAIPISQVYIESTPALGFSPRIQPSTSLTDVRCELWQLRNGPCPDPATLARNLWPDLTQSPYTLYLGLPGSCSRQNGYGFNVEYVEFSRTMIVHCYYAAPWVTLPNLRGSTQSEPITVLMTMQIEAVSPGILSVVRDDRIERLFEDQSDHLQLGTVTIVSQLSAGGRFFTRAALGRSIEARDEIALFPPAGTIRVRRPSARERSP
jgi:hypothetical protein